MLRSLRQKASIYYRNIEHQVKKSTLLAKKAPYLELYCIGDSHVEVFDFIEQHRLLPQTIISTTMVGGATAQGAVNPNSKTNALQIFMTALEKLNRSTHLLFMLGEVDCGFVIWYRATKYGNPVQEQLDLSLRNYFDFLTTVEAKGFQNIYVCTSHPPTIRDDQDFGEIANLRREVKATQRERTDLTFEYNAKLRALCEEKGYKLVSIESEVIDQNTNLVNEAFLNQDPTNHHLDMAKIAPFYVKELQAFGFK